MTSHVLPAKQTGHSHPSTTATKRATHSQPVLRVHPAPKHSPQTRGSSPHTAPAHSQPGQTAQMCPMPALCAQILSTDTRSACEQSVSETVMFIFLFSSLVLAWEHLMSQQLLQHPFLQAGRHLGHRVKPSQFKQEILIVCSWAPHKADRNNSNNNKMFASAFLPLISVAGGLCSA